MTDISGFYGEVNGNVSKLGFISCGTYLCLFVSFLIAMAEEGILRIAPQCPLIIWLCTEKKILQLILGFFCLFFFNGKTTLEPWFPFSVILLDICKISLSFMTVNGADFPLHATLCCELWLYWTYILSRTCIESLRGSSYGEMGANLELPSAFLGVLNWPDSAKSNV